MPTYERLQLMPPVPLLQKPRILPVPRAQLRRLPLTLTALGHPTDIRVETNTALDLEAEKLLQMVKTDQWAWGSGADTDYPQCGRPRGKQSPGAKTKVLPGAWQGESVSFPFLRFLGLHSAVKLELRSSGCSGLSGRLALRAHILSRTGTPCSP